MIDEKHKPYLYTHEDGGGEYIELKCYKEILIERDKLKLQVNKLEGRGQKVGELVVTEFKCYSHGLISPVPACPQCVNYWHQGRGERMNESKLVDTEAIGAVTARWVDGYADITAMGPMFRSLPALCDEVESLRERVKELEGKGYKSSSSEDAAGHREMIYQQARIDSDRAFADYWGCRNQGHDMYIAMDAWNAAREIKFYKASGNIGQQEPTKGAKKV